MSGRNLGGLIVVLLHIWSVNAATPRFKADYTPIVLWHGTGESDVTYAELQNQLRETLPGAYVLSLRIGNSSQNDIHNSYFLHPDVHIEIACEIVKNDPLLTNGFHAVGFSQGSQFLRALVQRCPEAKIKNLISMGGQHQGVYGFPYCLLIATEEFCDNLRTSLNTYLYSSLFQSSWTQVTYWHNPLNETEFRECSTFLADINNEVTIKQEYIERLQGLETFVLVKFENDTVVQPVETEWFGFYKPGQSQELETLEESALYKEDRLGLQRMNEESKIQFIANPGEHVKFEWEWFKETIVIPYLS